MAYALRHDFMANAVNEYMYEIVLKEHKLSAMDLAYAHMKAKMTKRERNDWFDMYKMGGEPFPHRG